MQYTCTNASRVRIIDFLIRHKAQSREIIFVSADAIGMAPKSSSCWACSAACDSASDARQMPETPLSAALGLGDTVEQMPQLSAQLSVTPLSDAALAPREEESALSQQPPREEDSTFFLAPAALRKADTMALALREEDSALALREEDSALALREADSALALREEDSALAVRDEDGALVPLDGALAAPAREEDGALVEAQRLEEGKVLAATDDGFFMVLPNSLPIDDSTPESKRRSLGGAESHTRKRRRLGPVYAAGRWTRPVRTSDGSQLSSMRDNGDTGAICHAVRLTKTSRKNTKEVAIGSDGNLQTVNKLVLKKTVTVTYTYTRGNDGTFSGLVFPF